MVAFSREKCGAVRVFNKVSAAYAPTPTHPSWGGLSCQVVAFSREKCGVGGKKSMDDVKVTSRVKFCMKK